MCAGGRRGLPGVEILLGARIVACADVFDALTSPRYYKPAYPIAKTLEIMDGMAGDHLDREVMAAVHRCLRALEATVPHIAGQFSPHRWN